MDRRAVLKTAHPLLHPYALAGVFPLLFFLVFYFYPLSGIFLNSFFQDASMGFGAVSQVFLSSRMVRILWFTFWQAGVSTLLTLVCALPCAFVISRYHFKGKKIIQTLASIPFVLPAVVVAAAFQACFGRYGFLGGTPLSHPLAMILMAHLFYNFSVMLRIISGFWGSLQEQFSDAAKVLGAGPFQVFFHITLPLLRPAVFSGCALVFMFCFSSFGIVLILGGPSYSTIEAEIYRQAAHLFNLPVASVLSLVQIGFTFMLLWGYTLLSRKRAGKSSQTSSDQLKKAVFLWEKLLVAGVVLFILGLCVMPLLVLVIHSLMHDGKLTLVFYRALFDNISGSVFYVPPVHAIGNSLLFAALSLMIALIIGGCAALFIHYSEKTFKHRLTSFFDPIFMLPLSTSAVTLGFGIIITLDTPPLNLRSSVFLVPIAHALVGFPFVVRAILPALRAMPDHLWEAAQVLGASPWQIFKTIDLPTISRSLVAGAVFAFTISLGEFGATVFAARPQTPTIPIAIYRFLGQPGAMNYGQAMAMATLLMMATALGFMLIETFQTKTARDF